jgi:hypothetical protein
MEEKLLQSTLKANFDKYSVSRWIFSRSHCFEREWRIAHIYSCDLSVIHMRKYGGYQIIFVQFPPLRHTRYGPMPELLQFRRKLERPIA